MELPMNATWQDKPRTRPDPYLEWEFWTRNPRDPGDLFCSLQIEILPDLAGDYLNNLIALRDAVDAGKLDGDPGGHTLRMAIDEKGHLLKVIDRVRHGEVIDDPVGVQFFIYRPEVLVYTDGTFSPTAIYK